MSLNPFELRFKLLEMSTEFLEKQANKQQDLAFEAWELAKEQGNATLEFWKTLQPATYSVEDIKKKAEELYEFVDKNDKR
jgi:flagellar hook-basal body complex protein FliE